VKSKRKEVNRLELVITSMWYTKTLEDYGQKMELEILLETEINNVEVLCFTEHWSNSHKIRAIKINQVILANAFCRKHNDHGGSWIFLKKKKGVMTKKLNSLNELGEETSFELSITELVWYAVIVTCI
jgi:hypothetical protein